MTMKESEKPMLTKGKNGGARPGSGRKKFQPTESERKQVEAMAGYGVPFDQIASLIRDGIHIDTLRARFQNELIRGKAKANAKIGQGMYEKAASGDTAAMIWWTKAQMGWREPARQLEHSGRDGSAIEIESRDVVPLNRDELMAELKARGLPTTIFGIDADT
jgi:hypothetical protein